MDYQPFIYVRELRDSLDDHFIPGQKRIVFALLKLINSLQKDDSHQEVMLMETALSKYRQILKSSEELRNLYNEYLELKGQFT